MKNEIRFTLEPKQRPKLAQKIGKILGTAPHYELVPSCAYDIAGYRLDKEGVLHIPEGVAVEMVEHLIRQFIYFVLMSRKFYNIVSCLSGIIPREILRLPFLHLISSINAFSSISFFAVTRYCSSNIEPILVVLTFFIS